MTSRDPARRRRLVAFVVVGWGLASVALLGALTWMAVHEPLAIDEDLNVPELSRWTRWAILLASMPGTAKGSFLIAITVLVLGWFLARDYRPGALVSAALTCTGATVAILKPLVERASPRAVAGAGAAHGVSFPSAHVARAAVVLAVVAVVWRWGPAWLVLAVRVVAGLAVAGVALSRLLLQFHWLTDVLAGLTVAGVWTAMTIPVAKALGSIGPGLAGGGARGGGGPTVATAPDRADRSVSIDGKVYLGGQELSVPEEDQDEAHTWLRLGYVSEAKPKRKGSSGQFDPGSPTPPAS